MWQFRKALVVAYLFLISPVTRAQNTGTLTGVITGDSERDTIAGAIIVSPGHAPVISDSRGRYKMVLPEGRHLIKFSVTGFSDVQREIKMPGGEVYTLHIPMHEEINPLEEIVVSAERYAQKLGEAVVSMEVIKPALIQNKNTTSLDQAMNQVPGVQVNDGQASIRGGSGFSYGAGSRVLLLVDEMPMISADAGDIKWNFLPLENLEQVEVLKGASSVLYGSGALNGVINFRTAFARNRPRTEASVFYGRYDAPRNTYKWWKGSSQSQQGVNLSHAQKIGPLDLVIGAHKYSDDGYRMLETENRDRLNTSLKFTPRKLPALSAGVNMNMMNVRGGLFFLWQHYDSAYIPQGRVIQNYDNKRFYTDPWITFTSDRDTAGAYKISLRNRYFKTQNENDKGQGSYAELYYSELQYSQRFRNGLNLTGGAVYMEQMILGDSIYGIHRGKNNAVYIQAVHKLFNKLTLSAGVRGEYYSLDTAKTRGYLFNHAGGPELPFQPVMRLGINYQAAPFTYVRASFGQGYRFPSVAEKFVSTAVSSLRIFPNTALKPERAYSAEFSVKQGFKVWDFRAYADLSAFYTRYYDMIEFVFDIYRPGGATGNLFQDLQWAGFKSQNVGQAEISGLELSTNGTGRVGPVNITVLAGYTYINPVMASYKEQRDTLGLPGVRTLKYRSRHLAKADVQFDLSRFSFGYSARYQSSIENIDRRFVQSILHEYHNPAIGIHTDKGPFILPGLQQNFSAFSKPVLVQDLRVSCWISGHVRLSFIVNNIGNVEYQARPGDVRPPTLYMGQLLVRI